MDESLPAPLDALAAPPDEGELGWLWRAQREGVPVAPMIVVPASVEAGFYRLNNLPERLRALFAAVDLADPDEDDLEMLAPAAAALVREHTLLAEVIEALFTGFERLPATVVVRRSGAAGSEVPSGTPALLALKRCWADEWRDECVARRLASGRGLAPEPRPVAIHTATVREAAVDSQARSGGVARAWTDETERLARVELASP